MSRDVTHVLARSGQGTAAQPARLVTLQRQNQTTPRGDGHQADRCAKRKNKLHVGSKRQWDGVSGGLRPTYRRYENLEKPVPLVVNILLRSTNDNSRGTSFSSSECVSRCHARLGALRPRNCSTASQTSDAAAPKSRHSCVKGHQAD